MQIMMDLQNGSLKCKFAQIDFSIDENEMSIFQIFVTTNYRRKGIGSALVKKLEEFAMRTALRRIVVSATPSRQALSFWKKAGYSYAFPEEINLERKVLGTQDPKYIEDTESGVIVLAKDRADIKT
jgi:GNAT superfamily N-acetyltransferase